MRCSLSLILLLAGSLHSRGQDFSYTQYNVKDGLAGSVVYCGAEDKDGFLWFGTESGLSRFDGTHFKNFTTTDGLPDNEIIKVFVDSRNRVWIVPFRNSICYYLKGQLHTQENDPVLHRLSITSVITAIQEDKYGSVIMTESTGINILYSDQRTETIREVGGSPALLPIGGGLTSEGLFSFFAWDSSKRLRQFTLDKGNAVFKGERNFVGWGTNFSLLSPKLNIFQDKDTLYIKPLSGENYVMFLPHNLNALSRIDDSLFTLNTTDGVAMYNFQTRKRSAFFLKGRSVNAVIRDGEGSFWFMSAGQGVFRIGSLGFRNTTLGEVDHLSVTCIQNIDDALYIGTERACLWRSDLSLQHIRRQKVSWHANNLGRILCIMPMDKNKMLLGTDGGLIRLDHLREDSLLEYFSIKTITRTKETLLIASMGVVSLRRCLDFHKLSVIWTRRATCSYQQDSLYYIGTLDGLYSVAPDGKARSWGNLYPIFKSRIVAIAEGADGTLWVATSGSGIAGIRNGRLVYSLTENDGLTSNICRTVFVSGADIWLGTDKGLNRIHFAGKDLQITNFGREDGLSSDIINVVYVKNNDVYVGSADGITHFNMHHATENSFCKLRVTSIRAAGNNWGYDTSGLVLPHRESSIRVDFAGISYRSAGDIIYRYRLRGLNDGWQTTRESFLSYPTLPSGSYELEIMATNKFGVQSAPVHIVFTVEKLVWEKGWVIFLVGAILTTTIWLLVRLRIQRLQRKNAEKISISNRMAELEQMSLRAQMNPHFIFNSLNSIQKYVIEKDIRGANKFITDFSRLIRMTLEITSKPRINIDEEVRYLSNYLELEKARFGHSFQYDIDISPEIDRLAYHIPTMLLQPYVENSIRHGLRYREDDKGMVVIRFMENEHYLICSIEDNGIGRELAQQYKSRSPIEYQSRGMTLTARRLEMMNQGREVPLLIHIEDMETEDHRPVGTKVLLYFPMQYVQTLKPYL